MSNQTPRPQDRQSSLFCIVFVVTIIFGLGSVCGTGIDKEVFKKDHRFQGRYVNTDQGVRRSFTFNLDGTVLREVTPPTDERQADGTMAKELTGHGTYSIAWKSMYINYDDGKIDHFDISLIHEGKVPDYESQTPDRIQLNGLIYTRAN
jgi:hypothetical protein